MSDRSNALDHDEAEQNTNGSSNSAVDADVDGDDDAQSGPTADPLAEPPPAVSLAERRRIRVQLVIVSAVVALGLFLVFRGIAAGVTGNERAKYPDAIESVTPVPEAVQAFGSDSIEVDLVAGYIGELTIDDIPIDTVEIGDYVPADVQPGAQIELPPVAIYEPGNATLVFTPSASAPIERFTVGQHTVQLVYWKIIDGAERPRTYTWTFNVK